VVLRWAVQRGTVPLPRSSTPSRVTENFGLFGWALSTAQMASLDALDATAGSAGRIMKGDHLVQEGGDWHEVWDEAWLAEWLATAARR
jgi:diketogulonate reductase-like aldo/keto reductase